MKLNIFIVRHGDTDDSENKRYSDRLTPLNEKGKKKAELLGNFLSEYTIKKIYTSPYVRTLSTATIIQQKCNCSVEIIDELQEKNHGKWTGYTTDEVKLFWPDQYHKCGENPVDFSPPGGENIKQVQVRTLKSIELIIDNNKGGNILMVTHGGIIHVLSMYINNIGLYEYWEYARTNKIKCCSLYHITDVESMYEKSGSNRASIVELEVNNK
jgi:broad specificity phosphatase PhoE